MSRARFRYGLQPLLLTRAWALDALRRDLADCNARVAQCRQRTDDLGRQVLAVDADWRTAVAGGLAVDQFMAYLRYRTHLAEALAQEETLLNDELAARVALIERFAGAMQALEAVEEHRDNEKAQFLRECAGNELKAADDHWGILQGRRADNAD